MATSEGWPDPTHGTGENWSMAKAGSRSLKAALREAGLSDRPLDETLPQRRRLAAERREAKTQASREETAPRAELARTDAPRAERQEAAPHAPLSASATAGVASPSLALFKDLIEKSGTVAPAHAGVVSPPPWLRAAQRGRRRAQLMNTFGWVMTLVVAGTIIGVAGRYLAVPPVGLETMQARPH